MASKCTGTKPGREGNYQEAVTDGCTMVNTTKVKGSFVIGKLEKMTVEMVDKGVIKNEEGTRVLALSGSHGNGVTGESGFTSIAMLKDRKDKYPGQITHGFYLGTPNHPVPISTSTHNLFM